MHGMSNPSDSLHTVRGADAFTVAVLSMIHMSAMTAVEVHLRHMHLFIMTSTLYKNSFGGSVPSCALHDALNLQACGYDISCACSLRLRAAQRSARSL